MNDADKLQIALDKDGGRIYPSVVQFQDGRTVIEIGISLRTHIAVEALKGLLSAGETYLESASPLDDEYVTNRAWSLADQMLKGFRYDHHPRHPHRRPSRDPDAQPLD